MGEWEIWDRFQVRSAGFPAAWLDGLALPPSFGFKERLRAEREHLRRLFGDHATLREAVVWQNPDFATNFLFRWLALAELPPDRSDARRVERKLLAYLQRYTAKNEAIGFFGPIGWGRLREELEQPRDEGGPWLVRRAIYWEPWLFQQLCQDWSAPPVLSPRLRVEGEYLHGEFRTRRRDGQIKLTAAQAALLAAPEEGQSDDPGLLESCLEKRWLSRAQAVPCGPDPERWARGRTDQPGHHRQLDQLEAHREALGQARGNPEELLIRSLELRRVLRTWGVTGTRFAGQTYSGRLPYYEDCQRRCLDLPAAPFKAVRDALELVLASARWFIRQAEQRFEQRLIPVCAGLIRAAGEGCCATPLWDRGHALFKDFAASDLPEVAQSLARTWRALLGPVEGEQIHRSSSLLRDEVLRAFQVGPARCSRGRFHSVDLFFTQQTGIVLGEVHPGLFPFHDISTNFQHPRREELARWYGDRAESPDLWPAWHMAFSRLAQDGWASPRGHHLLVDSRWGSWRPPERQLRLGDLSLFSGHEGFVVRHPTGLQVTPMELLQDELFGHLTSAFKPFDFGLEARPRIVIDRLTVARRRWCFEPARFGPSRERATRYEQLNRWADQQGMPDELFASYPKEVKPVLWQRRSALSCELFARMLPTDGVVKLEEMWPRRDHAWVATSQGQGTAEFRFVAWSREESER